MVTLGFKNTNKFLTKEELPIALKYKYLLIPAIDYLLHTDTQEPQQVPVSNFYQEPIGQIVSNITMPSLLSYLYHKYNIPTRDKQVVASFMALFFDNAKRYIILELKTTLLRANNNIDIFSYLKDQTPDITTEDRAIDILLTLHTLQLYGAKEGFVFSQLQQALLTYFQVLKNVVSDNSSPKEKETINSISKKPDTRNYPRKYLKFLNCLNTSKKVLIGYLIFILSIYLLVFFMLNAHLEHNLFYALKESPVIQVVAIFILLSIPIIRR